MNKATLTQWRIFNAVIDHGGYLPAAEKLNRSHSSLHHAIQKLQKQLGVPLLTVSGKQVRLTPVGEMVRRRSRQLLADAKDLETLTKIAQMGWETEVTLAVEGLYPRAILTDILKEFHARGENTRLKIDSVILNGAVEAITAAKADLVVTPVIPHGFFGTPLLTIPMRPYAHRDNPLVTSRTPIEDRELQRALQIVISDGTTTPVPATIGWLKSEQRWTVSVFYQARDILMSGMGFCWLAPHMFEEDIRSGLLQPVNSRDRLEMRIPLSLVIPAADLAGPATTLLADLFRKNTKLDGPYRAWE